MPDPTSADPIFGFIDDCLKTDWSPRERGQAAMAAKRRVAALRAELAEWKHGSAHEAEEADALRARLVQTGATLTDFANPDHWVQNDGGEWVWYGTYPPFERPALDLLGSLGSSSPEAPPVAAGES